MFLKIKKIIGGSAAIVLLIAWFYYAGLESSYIHYPRIPNPKAGLTVPHATKGIIVYITKEEQEFLSWLFWVMIGSGAVFGLVLLIHGGDPFKSGK